MLQLTEEELSSIIKSIAAKHFQKRKVTERLKIKGLTKRKRILIVLLYNLMDRGMAYDEIVWQLSQGETKQSAYEIRKEFKEIHEEIISKNEQTKKVDIKTKGMYLFMKSLGLT